MVGTIFPSEEAFPSSILETLLTSEEHSKLVKDIVVNRCANGVEMLKMFFAVLDGMNKDTCGEPFTVELMDSLDRQSKRAEFFTSLRMAFEYVTVELPAIKVVVERTEKAKKYLADAVSK